jgi:hypothetical protein
MPIRRRRSRCAGATAGEPPCLGEFISASCDFKTLGAFFCNSATLATVATVQRVTSKLPNLSVSPIGQPPRVPDLVGSRPPSPYHFRARIQSFQAVAAPFPGGSVLPAPRGQSPTPLHLPAKRRGEQTASRTSVRMRPKCHLVGGRKSRRSAHLSPPLCGERCGEGPGD